jgi:aminoglycoside/choline kinase family phosphotransferase
MQEMDLTIKYFISSHLDIKDDSFVAQLRHELKQIVEMISSLPMVTTHRDYHSRNIMIHDSQMFVIDFQDARQGLPQYDLVSLVDDCYFRLCEADKEYLKKYYYHKAKDKKIVVGEYTDFVHQYNLMKIQRTLKAIGSFCYINDSKANPRYLKYIGHAFNNIRELLIEKTEFSALGRLVKLYYEK